MKEIICGRKLVKFFGEGSEKRKVLDEVDVSVAKGEFLSVMGPSGSGKSTLLYTLSGMMPLTEAPFPSAEGTWPSAGKRSWPIYAEPGWALFSSSPRY